MGHKMERKHIRECLSTFAELEGIDKVLAELAQVARREDPRLADYLRAAPIDVAFIKRRLNLAGGRLRRVRGEDVVEMIDPARPRYKTQYRRGVPGHFERRVIIRGRSDGWRPTNDLPAELAELIDAVLGG